MAPHIYQTKFNSSEKVWSGLNKPTIYNPHTSIGNVVLEAMTLIPSKVAQISANNGIELTYEELRNQTVRAAQNLKQYGYEKGDIFAVASTNNHELAPIVFALISSGHPINLLDTAFSEVEMSHMLSITRPKAVFCEVDVVDMMKQCLQKLNNNARIFTICGSKDGYIAAADLFVETGCEDEFIAEEVDERNEIAVIVCSSGTTGLSKGVSLSHRSILEAFLPWYGAEDVIFSFSSLYWLSGVMFLLFGTIRNCTRIISTAKYSPELFLEVIEKFRVTHVFSSSFQLITASKCSDISRRNLSSIKNFISGGSKVPYDATLMLKKYIPNGEVNVGYGMSEVAGCVSVNWPWIHNDSVGRLSPGIKVKIIDGDGNRLGVNEEGEISVKPVNRFFGYFNNPTETGELYDEEDYIRSGDIGRFDEHGNLYIIDRKKDFLKYRSYTISPSEIEEFLITLSGVQSSCVAGIEDYESGDLPAVAIVRTKNSQLSEQEIYDRVAEKFNEAKKLRGGVYFFDSLPTTPSGKVLRREVKRQLNDLYRAKNQV